MNLVLQKVSRRRSIPSNKSFHFWVNAVLAVISIKKKMLEVTIRIVDEAEITRLNHCFRNKSRPTNVLAFPYKNLQSEWYLGDIVICAPITIQEAKEQKKTIEAHFAHLTIHGVLHLLGYDHKKTQEAKKMEELEIAILDNLGYKNPYYESRTI
jgi:probable rRNA maturation factor